MKYEISNLKENKVPVLSVGSEPRLITESIEFDIMVKTDRAVLEGHLEVEPMLPTDFQKYVKRIANKISKDIEEKSAIKLDSIEVNMDLTYKG